MKLSILFFLFNKLSFIFYKSIDSYKNRHLRLNFKYNMNSIKYNKSYHIKYDKILKTPFENPKRFNITKKN